MSDHTPAKKAPEAPHRFGLSIDESCHASGIGRTKIYEAIGAGELIARKCGRRTVILPRDLEAWLTNLPVADFASGEASPDRAA